MQTDMAALLQRGMEDTELQDMAATPMEEARMVLIRVLTRGWEGRSSLGPVKSSSPTFAGMEPTGQIGSC
jgi:hypothetical protein